jgi:hypothetical protein
MIFRLIVAFLSVFLLVNNISAKNITPKKTAKSIYVKAQSNSDNLNYKTVLRKKVGKGSKIDNFFHKVSQDGTVFTRREIIREPYNPSSPLGPYIEINNNAGRFRLLKGKAIKMNFQWLPSKMDETGLEISYSLSMGKYKEIPCYIITKKTKPNQLAYERYIKTLPKSCPPKSYKDKFDSFFHAADVAYIGKKDMFFRKIISYGIKGKSLGMREYGEVYINPTFNKNLFKVPSNDKLLIMNSAREYFKIRSKAIQKKVARRENSKQKNNK